MNLKNYTSNVPAESTIARIEARLAAIGALSITKIYDPHAQVAALSFIIPQGAKTYQVMLPANADACFQAMLKEHNKAHKRTLGSTQARIKAQAGRTAWRLMQDWVDVQISLIVMQQADFLQVFMSYLWDGKQTYYQYVQSNGFKALPEKTQ